MKFEGIYTPIITPHTEDGSIDKEAFAEVKEFTHRSSHRTQKTDPLTRRPLLK